MVIGRFKIWLGPPFLSAALSVTLCTSFLASVSILTILAIGYWFQWQSSLSKKISPAAKFRILFFHICLTCRLWRNSFLNLLQNSPAICCTRHHRLFEYTSSLLNSPGGGMRTLVFIVRRLLGKSGISLFEPLMVSTVSGLEVMISSMFNVVSAINVLSDSSFKGWLLVFNKPSKIVLPDRILCSQTLPIWEVPGGLSCYRIQSAPFSCKKLLMLMFHLFEYLP